MLGRLIVVFFMILILPGSTGAEGIAVIKREAFQLVSKLEKGVSHIEGILNTRATLFVDSRNKIQSRFSQLFRGFIDEAFTQSAQFTEGHDYFLVGEYVLGKDSLTIKASLKKGASQHICTATAIIDANGINRDWFALSFEEYIDILLEKLMYDVGSKESLEVILKDVRYRDTPYGSETGAYLTDSIRTRILNHAGFKLKAPSFLKQYATRGLKVREMADDEMAKINESRGKTLTDLVGAKFIFGGEYWDTASHIRVGLTILDAKDASLLAAESINIPIELFPGGIDRKPMPDGGIIAAEKALKLDTVDKNLSLELWTNHGESGTYLQGEKMQIFFRANQECYVRVYYLMADGAFLEIFPGLRANREGRVLSGQVVEVPDPYGRFVFEVSEPFGMELIKAYASTKPMAHIEGDKIEGTGLKGMKIKTAELITRLFPDRDANVMRAEKSLVVTTVKRIKNLSP